MGGSAANHSGGCSFAVSSVFTVSYNNYTVLHTMRDSSPSINYHSYYGDYSTFSHLVLSIGILVISLSDCRAAQLLPFKLRWTRHLAVKQATAAASRQEIPPV